MQRRIEVVVHDKQSQKDFSVPRSVSASSIFALRFPFRQNGRNRPVRRIPSTSAAQEATQRQQGFLAESVSFTLCKHFQLISTGLEAATGLWC